MVIYSDQQLFKVGPREKVSGAKVLFRVSSQPQLLKAASKVPFTLKVFCLCSPEMQTFAGPLAICPTEVCLRAEPPSVPVDHNAGNPLVGPCQHISGI